MIFKISERDKGSNIFFFDEEEDLYDPYKTRIETTFFNIFHYCACAIKLIFYTIRYTCKTGTKATNDTLQKDLYPKIKNPKLNIIHVYLA